jgi:hypothetical protein
MTKEIKTKSELTEIVRDKLQDLRVIHVEVRTDPVYGWRIFFLSAPSLLADYQIKVGAIERELRARYELEN